MAGVWRYKFAGEEEGDWEGAEEALAAGAKCKLTGEYEHDAAQLRRGRRLFWELYGPEGREPPPETGPRRVTKAEKERKKRLEEEEMRRVNLARVSQRLLLEREDLEAKIGETRREFGKLARRKLVLEEEWKKLHVEKAALTEDKRRFQAARKSPWFQSNLLPTSDLRRVRINVGGQLFETSEKVLKRDPGSLLAALVQPDTPVKPNEDGCFMLDRDWLLFRHILAFLRDGILPQVGSAADDQLVAALYKEADFYHLETLRCAIREYLDPYQLVEKSAAVPLSKLHRLEAKMLRSLKTRLEDLKDDGFEYKPPEIKKEAAKEEDKYEWWTKATYKGKDFGLKPKPLAQEPARWKGLGNALEHSKAEVAEETRFSSTWKLDRRAR